MNFQEHCLQLGIQLLSDDIKFIKYALQSMPKEKHKEILCMYTKIWLQGINKTQHEFKKQNEGRRVANSYLLMAVL